MPGLGFLQRLRHVQGLLDGHRPVIVRVDDQHRLGLGGDMLDGRGQPPRGQRIAARRGPDLAPRQLLQLVRRRQADHPAKVAGVLFPAARSRERAVAERGRQRHQVPAGRHADQEDPLGVDLVLGGVGMDPADGAEQVLVASRRRSAAGQAVVDRHGEEAQPRPLGHVDGAFAGRFELATQRPPWTERMTGNGPLPSG